LGTPAFICTCPDMGKKNANLASHTLLVRINNPACATMAGGVE
jgi:hypothetical protein